MGTLCSACGKAELNELVKGIMQCPLCKKVFRNKVVEEKKVTPTEEILDGSYFMRDVDLNPKWEIADKGITVEREENKSWFAVLLCHTPDFPNNKYIRLSWWKKTNNEHAGMYKIEEPSEADNVILALETIEKQFDDRWEPIGKVNTDNHPTRPEEDIEIKFDTSKKICPVCKFKMKQSKNHRYFECEHCGEIIVVEDGQPIFDVPNEKLGLCLTGNYPVNFYLPAWGITVRLSMGEWKAIVIIYAKENPEKRWLRFYWWRRDLQEYITSEFTFGMGASLKWEPRKGTLSPNMYEKRLIKPTISAIKKMKELWLKSNEERDKPKGIKEAINGPIKQSINEPVKQSIKEPIIESVESPKKESIKVSKKSKRIIDD